MINNKLHPILTALPGRYAKALFKVGKINNCLDTLFDNFKLHSIFTSFVNVLINNRRFSLINKIESIFRHTFTNYKNEKEIAIYSPVKINKTQEKEIEEIMKQLFEGKKLIIKYGIKKELLTGMQIYSDGFIYDLSGSASIRQLSNYLKSVSNV